MCFRSSAGKVISGVIGCLIFWLLKRKPGLTGKIALSSEMKRSVLMIAANSLALFPEARAVRNKVFFIKRS